MKKRIVVFVLLIAVVSGMAFAQVGRNIPFTQMSFSDKVKVSKVEETSNGIKVSYAPQENNPRGWNFLALANYKNGTAASPVHNSETGLGKYKYIVEEFTMKINNPSTISSVYFFIGDSKKQAENYLGAEKVLSAASMMPELEILGNSYNQVVGTLSKISTAKDVYNTVSSFKNLFDAAKAYKTAGNDSSKESARRSALYANLDFIENVGGLALGNIQSSLLGMAAQAARNYMNMLYARYDYINWLSDCTPGYDELATNPAYRKYAQLGQQLFDSGVSLPEIKQTFEALVKLENKGK
jgi:hypothetical protein